MVGIIAKLLTATEKRRTGRSEADIASNYFNGEGRVERC